MFVPLLFVVSTHTPDSLPVEANPRETHLRNVRQLTFGGQNAEAYWSPDGRWLVYQTLQPGYPDEQIFVMRADGSDKTLVSTGKGRCTCSYFTPDMKWIYFSSTHEENPGPQKPVDFSKGYVWMVNPDFKMYRSPFPIKGQSLEKVVGLPGYVAETTIAPNGSFMTWTSDHEGDLDIYRSDLKGGHIQRLTNQPGYDGGPFVSWDSKKIVYRRDEFTDGKQLEDYRDLLKEHLIRPTKLEIWIMDADGRNKRQVTHLGCASFAPFLAPDGKTVVFSSNYGDPRGREFDIFAINVDGTRLRRITYTKEFDGFPMFTRNGRKLVFCSNRNGKVPRETNVFVADWAL